MKLFWLLVFFLMPLSAQAAQYEIDFAESSISFSGTHAGNTFEGIFESWSADINFDPEDLENSSVKAVFDLNSAKTGNKMYDGTLPQDDWFDVKNHPQGHFVSKNFEAGQGRSFVVHGGLTLRGSTHPVAFEFSLTDAENMPVIMTTVFPIDRLLYGIGIKSDPSAEWVSQEIMMKLNIVARNK